MKVDEIYPNLFARGEFRNQKYKLEHIRGLGIKLVVCLINQDDPDLRGYKDFEYIHYPLPDGKTVPDLELEFIAEAIAVKLRREQKVLIHCRAGRNRTGLVAGAVIKRLTGWKGQQIIDYMRHYRPGLLANPYYEEYIRNL